MRIRYRLLLGVLAATFAFCELPSAKAQQGDRAVPRQDYYLSLAMYREGEFVRALQGFRQSFKGGIRSTAGRWVDSICYHAMMGECLHQMGEPAAAVEQFNSALLLYVAHRDWMLRVQFPESINPTSRGPRPPINWGNTVRRTTIGNFPDTMSSLQGNLDNEAAVRNGGVVVQPQLYPLRVTEIIRCTALAMRRRAEIMGAACEHDPLTNDVLLAATRRSVPPNHWSQAWASAFMGLAYVADGKIIQATAELQQSLQIAGTLDHPLTATALLELGKLAFRQGKFEAASTYFMEATYSAAAFDQPEIMEEAFRWGSITHLVTGQQGVYPPLAPAAIWSKRNSKFLNSSVLVSAAENYAAMNDPQRAGRLLSDARRMMGRSDLLQSRLGARFIYQNALVNFQTGNMAAGTEAFGEAMKFQQEGSLWLYQIALADQLYRTGAVTERVASQLFDDTLREPTSQDWTVFPMETLSVVVTPHLLPMEHWFEIALARKEHEKALTISDRIRRHRFYSTLPMGGRLLSLRWVLQAPKESLSETALLQRQDLLAKYPAYAQLAAQVAAANDALDLIALMPADEEQAKKQKELLTQLATHSTTQEMLLRQIALRREASEFAFPPLREVKDLKDTIPEGQAVLAFFATSRYVYAFLMADGKYSYWQVESPAQIRRHVMNLLRQMGHFELNSELDSDDLTSEPYLATARSILLDLTDGSSGELLDNLDKFDELVIVPDSILWYLPFDALPLTDGKNYQPLISKVRVRYAPTVALTQSDNRSFKPRTVTGVVTGKLFLRDDASVAEEAFADLESVLPNSAQLSINTRLPVPSALFAKRCDRLIVYDDLTDSARVPYDWAPLPVDRGKAGSSLATWLPLPWGGPEQIVLPGFHTAAENSLKKGGTGDEIFLSLCGMMSTGTRTILLSRWRTAGKSSYDLMREFAQELPHTSPSKAWQRSVQLSMLSELEPDLEPRVKDTAARAELKARHPFFWSGYLLVDTGGEPK